MFKHLKKMVINVYRTQHFNTQPESYCIVGTAPVKKIGCEYSEQLQVVGSVKFSARKGSFDGECGTIKSTIFDPLKYKICCGTINTH